jgi:hypothetical protein
MVKILNAPAPLPWSSYLCPAVSMEKAYGTMGISWVFAFQIPDLSRKKS